MTGQRQNDTGSHSRSSDDGPEYPTHGGKSTQPRAVHWPRPRRQPSNRSKRSLAARRRSGGLSLIPSRRIVRYPRGCRATRARRCAEPASPTPSRCFARAGATSSRNELPGGSSDRLGRDQTFWPLQPTPFPLLIECIAIDRPVRDNICVPGAPAGNCAVIGHCVRCANCQAKVKLSQTETLIVATRIPVRGRGADLESSGTAIG